MRRIISRLFPIRPGEAPRLAWLTLIGVAYAAATSLGDDIAQSLFVTRVGADALPRMFIFKGLLDIVAAALYLPLTRGRSPSAVWRVAIVVYVLSVLGARIAISGGGVVSAYGLYVAHECAWTILTIHWGVFILDAFDASQARRLFPLLFTAARLGGMLAGSLLQLFAERLGADDMLFVCAGFAVVAGVLPRFGAHVVGAPAPSPTPPTASPPARPAEEPQPSTLWAGWRRAASSPLVRIIAVSTAAMVLVRYGLRMVSIDHISAAFEHDENQVAAFLGWFATWANLAGLLLGIFVVPGLLHRFGVGAANMIYALATLGACSALVWTPGLVVAGFARFVDLQFKSALKTPLSTLFYGAEPPRRRTLARAFIFGAIIPAATLSTSVLFELVQDEQDLRGVAWLAVAVAVVFSFACWVQNRRWRVRLRQLLSWKLARAAAPEPAAVAETRAGLREHRERTDDPRVRATLDDIATGLASRDQRLRAVSEEVLAETIPRMRAHRLAKPFVNPETPAPD